MASTTAGQQQPVMIRGFDVGINPSMLSGVHMGDTNQQQQQAYQQSLFGNANATHNRHSSYSSTTSAPSAFVIPHVGSLSTSGNDGGSISTDDLVEGLQQSMASMDATHHQHYTQPSYGPRASSAASSTSSSSKNGNAQPGGVSMNAAANTRPFDIARSPTFSWHGYRPGSSGQNSNSNSSYALDAFSSIPPNLTRHVSSPSSFLAAAAAAHNPAQHHLFFASSGDGSSGMQTPRSPLELFPSPSVGSSLPMNPEPTPSITASDSVYPFASASNSSETISNLDGRLSSFHRHQAHAQSNSYSSAFSPSSFLANGLASPSGIALNPSQAFPTQHTLSNQSVQSRPQHRIKTPQSRTTSLYDAASDGEAVQRGQRLNANNKRPGSADPSKPGGQDNTGRQNTNSPNEEANVKGQQPQQRGRSQGRTPASGKAPSASRNSRSRTRRPSYSRTISPAGSIKAIGGGIAPSISPGSTSASQQQVGSMASQAEGANTVIAPSASQSQTKYPNPYAPQLSPYMPGYPSLLHGNSDAAPVSKPSGINLDQQVYSSSVPAVSSAGFEFMKLNEQQALSHAQIQAATAGMAYQRPGSANSVMSTFDLFVAQQGRDTSQRGPSDTSTCVPSSLGTIGDTNKSRSMDLLNSPAAYTGPLPLPHQEGFRSSGPKLDHSNGADGPHGGDQGDGDFDSGIRGRQPQDDKRRKRRESHNAVERRRRDNINDRITELASLIPEILLDTGNSGAGAKTTSRSQSRNGRGGDNDDSPDRRGDSPSSNSASAFPAAIPLNAQFTPAQLAQQAAANRPNKGVILTKSVEYIRYLQQLVQLQGERNRELEIRVRMLEGHAAVAGGMPNMQNSLPPGFLGAINNNGMVGNAALGSPGIPLGGGSNVRSLPPLEEGEATMDEGTGLSHKRDQFTARRSASRNSMNASDGNIVLPRSASTRTMAVPASAVASHQDSHKDSNDGELPLPSQGTFIAQDWIDNGLAEMTNNGFGGHGSTAINGHASPPSSGLMQDHHHMTFEDLLQVGRSNRVVSDSQDSAASGSPIPSIGKMEDDDENALGMQL